MKLIGDRQVDPRAREVTNPNLYQPYEAKHLQLKVDNVTKKTRSDYSHAAPFKMSRVQVTYLLKCISLVSVRPSLPHINIRVRIGLTKKRLIQVKTRRKRHPFKIAVRNLT